MEGVRRGESHSIFPLRNLLDLEKAMPKKVLPPVLFLERKSNSAATLAAPYSTSETFPKIISGKLYEHSL